MALVSVLRCAQLSQAIYNPIAPGVFQRTWNVNGVTMGYTCADGIAVFAFAGSEVTEDWVRDFTALKYEHPVLGTVHKGFWEGMQDLFGAVQSELHAGNKVVVTGHSLGAAHAQLFAGLCIADGVTVAELVLFAPPRAGMSTLKSLIQSAVQQTYAYRNLNDPVPEVPVYIPLVEAWQDAVSLERMSEQPDGNGGEVVDALREHSMVLYLRGAAKITD